MFRVVCGSDICKNIAEDYLNACVCGTENGIEANENTFFLLLAFHFYLSIFSFLLFWSMSSYSSHLNAYEKKLFIIVLSIRSFIFFPPSAPKKASFTSTWNDERETLWKWIFNRHLKNENVLCDLNWNVFPRKREHESVLSLPFVTTYFLSFLVLSVPLCSRFIEINT